jgi:hypothetical protein
MISLSLYLSLSLTRTHSHTHTHSHLLYISLCLFIWLSRYPFCLCFRYCLTSSVLLYAIFCTPQTFFYFLWLFAISSLTFSKFYKSFPLFIFYETWISLFPPCFFDFKTFAQLFSLLFLSMTISLSLLSPFCPPLSLLSASLSHSSLSSLSLPIFLVLVCLTFGSIGRNEIKIDLIGIVLSLNSPLLSCWPRNALDTFL